MSERIKNCYAKAEMAPTEIKEAVQTVLDFFERVIYAVMAFLVTYYGLSLFHVTGHAALEPAALNAGVAYFTHEVTGKVVRAIGALATPPAKAVKHAVVKTDKVQA